MSDSVGLGIMIWNITEYSSLIDSMATDARLAEWMGFSLSLPSIISLSISRQVVLRRRCLKTLLKRDSNGSWLTEILLGDGAEKEMYGC